jgi:hypothetical protein
VEVAGTSPEDGGHRQFHQGPYLIAMWATGNLAHTNNLMANAAGNWNQAFKHTTATRNEVLTPHDDLNLPSIIRRRTLGVQPGGSVLRIPLIPGGSNGDDNEVGIPAGAVAWNVPRTKSATVATSINMPHNGTLMDVTLTGANPFVAGDVIYFEVPSAWIPVDSYDWIIRQNRRSRLVPAAGQSYRQQQQWHWTVLALHNMGILHAPTMESVIGYTARAMEANNPTASNDFFMKTDNTAGGNLSTIWDLNWPTVSAIPQRT